MNLKYDTIEQAIIDSLNQIPQSPNIQGNKAWTKQVKKLIGELGQLLNYDVCLGDKELQGGFERQWLYDIVWFQNDGGGNLYTVPLVVESEWRTDFTHIKYDFEKLLLANAEHRLMICQAKQRDKSKLLEYFENAISVYKTGQIGDRFLIALLEIESEEFEYILFRK